MSESTKEEESKIYLHVVHSVKGGCGKTTFSLQKAMELSKECGETELSRILMIDCDFRGSALQALIYGQTQEEYERQWSMYAKATEDIKDFLPSKATAKGHLVFEETYNDKTLNDFFRREVREPIELCRPGKFYVLKDELQENLSETSTNVQDYILGRADFIFSSYKAVDKEMFKMDLNEEKANESYIFGQTRFKVCIKELLTTFINERLNAGSKELRYKHIVIDMPPGTDEYANSLLKCVRSIATKNENVILYYYTITTADTAHRIATQEHIGTFLEGSETVQEPNKIYVICNEAHDGEYACGVSINKIKQELLRTLEKKKLRDKPLTLVHNQFQKDFYKSCRQNDKQITFSYKIEEKDTIEWKEN